MELRNYLIGLRNKTFKLLPMKESFDSGVDNHIFDYLDNVISEFNGALNRYIILKNECDINTVLNNLYYLKNSDDIKITKWRTIVLRSCRLIQTLSDKYVNSEVNNGNSMEHI